LLCPLLLIPFMQASAQDFSFTCDSLVQQGELGTENLFIALLTNNTDERNHIRLELNDEHLPDAWNYFWCVGQLCLPPDTYSFDDTLAANATDTVFLHIFSEDVKETGEITITAVPVSNPSPRHVRAYPNPFNPNATISYTLEKAGYTEVTVVDLLGQPIRNLFRGWQMVGTHNLTWDGTGTRGVNMPGGIYLVTVENGGKSRVVRLIKLE